MNQINNLIDKNQSIQPLRVAFKYTINDYFIEVFDPISFKEYILQDTISLFHLSKTPLTIQSTSNTNTFNYHITEQLFTNLIIHTLSLLKQQFSFTINDILYFVDCNDIPNKQISNILKTLQQSLQCQMKLMSLKEYVDDLFLYFKNFEFKVTYPNEKEKVVDESLFNHWKSSYYSFSSNKLK